MCNKIKNAAKNLVGSCRAIAAVPRSYFILLHMKPSLNDVLALILQCHRLFKKLVRSVQLRFILFCTVCVILLNASDGRARVVPS